MGFNSTFEVLKELNSSKMLLSIAILLLTGSRILNATSFVSYTDKINPCSVIIWPSLYAALGNLLQIFRL